MLKVNLPELLSSKICEINILIGKAKSMRVLSITLQLLGITVVPITFLTTSTWYGYPVPYVEIGGILIGVGVLLSSFHLKLKNLLDLFQAGAVLLGIYYIAETRFGGPGSPYLVIIPSDSPSFFMFPIAGLIADLGLLILSFATTLALGKYVLFLRKLYMLG